MGLFEKPYRVVSRVDAADAVSPGDVAVVESVMATEPDPASPAASSASPADPIETAAPEIPAVPVPTITVPTVAVPTIAVPTVAVPTVASSETSTPSMEHLPVAVAAPPSDRTLVAAGDHGLRHAGDATGLVEFARVVPHESKSARVLETQRLISAIDEADPVLDQMRSLAASLHQARTGRELKVIAVTSSVSGEGKTLLAANLALTLSRSYMRQVLMIDADLRRPNLHRLFGTASGDGIRSAIESVRDGRPVAVQEVAPRLALLPAGKPVRDPISVLASDAMQRLLIGANAAFDWIVIDTPPVGMLPDVGLLSSLSDAVLLVVESGRVRFDLVQRTVESIGADRIFGVVLNKVPEQDIVAAYGMHYYAPYR